MADFRQSPHEALDDGQGFERPIEEPELEGRLAYPGATMYTFVSLLEDSDEPVQELSRVKKVEEYSQNGLGGIYIVQFSLLHPVSEEEQKTSNAYFFDGTYQGEVDEESPLILADAGGVEAKVVSGYFLNRRRRKPIDKLLIGVMEARQSCSGDDPIM